ncbi:MAG: hypothetical protein ACRDRX_17850 [Pseudonocardiaceae bacterium]
MSESIQDNRLGAVVGSRFATIDARLDAIGLVVADMAASLAFYRLLGLGSPDQPFPRHAAVRFSYQVLDADRRIPISGLSGRVTRY